MSIEERHSRLRRMHESYLVARREKHYCEWISACYHDGPLLAGQGAIRTRRHHGYMADYGLARRLVQEAIANRCHSASPFGSQSCETLRDLAAFSGMSNHLPYPAMIGHPWIGPSA